MYLADLDSEYSNIKVLILQTPSIKLDTFIRDKVKKKLKTITDTTLSLVNAKDYKNVRGLINIQPQLADKWFVDVNVTKFGVTKDLIDMIENSTTCAFFCKVDNYKDYKKLKEELKKVNGVFDFYMSYLKRMDIIYLYDAIVPKGLQMKKPLFDYLVQSYSSDVEAIMTLFDKMKRGVKIEKRSDISDICGIGGNTVESFMFSLLKDPPTTEKGIDKVISNRVRAALELAEVLGYDTFYNYLSSSLKAVLNIKMLLLSSIIYKRIINLPESFNERKLVRYQRYLWLIKNTPTSRIVRCKNILSRGKWRKDIDIFNFIFTYIYNQEKYEVTPYIQSIIPNKDVEEDKKIDDTKLSDEELEFSLLFNNFKEENSRDFSEEAINAVYNEALRKGIVAEVEDKEEVVNNTKFANRDDSFSIITSSAMNIDNEDNMSALEKSGVSLLELAEILITGNVTDDVKLKLHNSNLAVQQNNVEFANKPKETEVKSEEAPVETQEEVQDDNAFVSTGDLMYDLQQREVQF